MTAKVIRGWGPLLAASLTITSILLAAERDKNIRDRLDHIERMIDRWERDAGRPAEQKELPSAPQKWTIKY